MNTILLCVRQGSTRLPGKALARLGDRTVLQHLIERYQSCKRVNKVIVVATRNDEDKPIERVCQVLDVPCHREGPGDMVTEMNNALHLYAPDATFVFRGLGDMLLFDVELLNWRFDILRQRRADVVWTGYSDEPWPVYGSRESPWSRRAWDDIVNRSTGSERVHAGQWLYTNLQHYRVLHVERLQDEYYLPYRLELDTPQDYEMFKAVYRALWDVPGGPTTLDALRWLKANPDIVALNDEVVEKTLTQISWRKRGVRWACVACGAAPMETGVIKKGRLETTCGRCGATRDFVEVPGFMKG